MDQDPGMWWTQNVVMFFLVLCRVGSMVMVAPMFSSRSIPVQLKAGFAAAVSLVIFPIVRPMGVAAPMEMVGLTTAALGEMIIGLTLGFGAAIVFVGIEMGGTLISRHMGTALANVFNPLFSSSSPALGQFYSFVALIVFLGMNGHHGLLKILIGTFTDVPLMQGGLNGGAMMGVVWMLGDAYVIAFKVAAPVMVSLLLVTVALGFIARTVPQVEVLIAGFPLNVGVGLVVAMVTLGAMALFFERTFQQMLVFLSGLVRLT